MAGDDLLAAALDAHGGAGRWAAVEEIAVSVRSGGFALVSKGRGRDVREFRARVSAHRPRTVVEDFGAPGLRGVFEPGRVRIEDADGAVVAERRDPRAAFGGRRNLWWDRLDLLYFAGYALWGYLTQPFLLAGPGFQVREIEPWDEGTEPRRRLHVTFPPEIPAHSREQVFHFDDQLRIRRNDYTAEVFGGWARAAHYSDDHREHGGLLFPARRRVYPRARSGHRRPLPLLVRLDLDSVEPVSGAPAR
jgi:hypothetical protein